MVKQTGAALALALLAAVTAPALLSQSAAAAKQDALKVKKKALKPKRVSGAGGQIFVNVEVSKRNHEIVDVRAQARIPGQAGGETVTLTRKGKAYSGTVQVPANTVRQPVKGSVYLYVTTNKGQEPNYFLAGVNVDPAVDSLPPPPPPAN
jgi:hypothetical protein